MDLFIVHYQDQRGMAGTLKGIIAFTDGQSYKVWDAELHAQCQALARERVTPVRYTSRASLKWGPTLTTIAPAVSYEDAYDAARAEDEQRGRVTPNSYLGRKIAKGVA
jgi:hypothetical protein